METCYFTETRWAGGDQEGLPFEMENFWRILSLGGMVPSPLDDWQQPRGSIGKVCEASCGGLHMRNWWGSEVIRGGEEQTRYILNNSYSQTVLSCVREVESKCCRFMWNDFTVGYWYYSEYQKEALSKRNQKQIDFGGICWHLIDEDGLVGT